MRYFNWLLRAMLFIALLGFAVKNDQPVTVRYFLGFEWESSLVIVLLAFFAVGTVFGLVAMFGNLVQLRREIARLKQDIQVKKELSDLNEGYQTPSQFS